MKKYFPLLFIFVAVLLFFRPFITQNKLPIPSDTIVGLYHPFRDVFAKDYPRGIPFKNFLITDPVRQQYPLRLLSIDLLKNFSLPLWNPYVMSGYPLLGSFQSAAFYPMNIFLLLLPFSFGWSFLILLQPLLAGSFLYLYLYNLKLTKSASFLGAITFSFCGFSVAWLEWGTIVHTGLWLPLVLLSIDKITLRVKNHKSGIRDSNLLKWCFIFIFSLSSSFFAGHLQTFFYLFIFSAVYLIARWWQDKKYNKLLIVFALCYLLFAIASLIQWLPTLNFINLSARSVDQNWLKEGWFIPWENLIQFIAPDFFGNPATLNYWGKWNYAEFVGYTGILPLIMAFYAFFRRDKKSYFFGIAFILPLVFALPTFIAKIPFILQIPFVSTAQPTRLLFISSFSLSILAALGFDYLIKNNKKQKIIYPIIFISAVVLVLWIVVLNKFSINLDISTENTDVAKRNLYFPSFIFASVSVLLLIYGFVKNNKARMGLIVLLLIISVFDILRFANKFTPFTDKQFLFPATKTITYLQNQKGHFRIMATDDKIFPPNFSVNYRLQSVEGYDPLYLLRYGELISAMERGKPDISPPFGFNRIITPHKINSEFIDLLGVKYVMSLSEINNSKFDKVLEEGETKLYKNKQAFQRAFFVDKVKKASGKQEAIEALFENKTSLRNTAIVENGDGIDTIYTAGQADIVEYKENEVVISTQNDDEGFLILMDTYYPTWHASICNLDGYDCNNTKIHLTNYNFRGVVIPAGRHKVIFNNLLL